MTMSSTKRDYAPGEHPDLPPPSSERGLIHWLRTRLFNSWLSAILTVVALVLIGLTVPSFLSWAIINASWTATGPEACPPASTGACWGFVGERFYQYMFGFYPRGEAWRPITAFVVMALAISPLVAPNLPGRSIRMLFAILSPFIILALLAGGDGIVPSVPFLSDGGVFTQLVRLAFFGLVLAPAVIGARALMSGQVAFTGAGFFRAALPFVPIAALLVLLSGSGLTSVGTANWGGLLLSLVVGVTGIVASLPLGILLALGRQSSLPIVRAVSVFLIEVPRGVPLITLLFMASVMLPLFVPEGVSFDKLVRALVVVALFASAYMAEVIRGGLQAIPKGQAEAAAALGLGFWQTTTFIVMPQALRIVIPGIVNTFIGLFKDTTLVMIIGLYDLLGIANAALQDPDWLGRPGGVFLEAYFFVAAVFWVFTFGMSQYSAWLEKRLDTGHGAKGA